MTKIIHRHCPLCQTNNAQTPPKTNYCEGEWIVKSCKNCHFVYLENTPIYEAFYDQYAWEKTSATEEVKRKQREPVIHTLSHYFKQLRRQLLKRDKLQKLIRKYFDQGNILDIGCGNGKILFSLHDNLTPYGIEISEHLANEGNKTIRHKGGQIVHNDALSGLKSFEQHFFDGIIMSAFLEHELQPKKLLQSCYSTLKPNGKVIIKVPNYGSINRRLRGKSWCGFRYPDHVNYFTPRTLKQMCIESGFNIEKFNLLDRHPLSDNMWIVLTKKEVLS